VIAQLQAAGLQSMDLLHEDYADTDRREHLLNGLCYPLSEALYYACPGQFTPWRILWEAQGSHWFLKAQDGAIVDLVAYPELLCHPDAYAAGQRVGFLSSPRMSWRCRVLLERAGLKVPTSVPREKKE
jgi:hypothetical protein